MAEHISASGSKCRKKNQKASDWVAKEGSSEWKADLGASFVVSSPSSVWIQWLSTCEGSKAGVSNLGNF